MIGDLESALREYKAGNMEGMIIELFDLFDLYDWETKEDRSGGCNYWWGDDEDGETFPIRAFFHDSLLKGRVVIWEDEKGDLHLYGNECDIIDILLHESENVMNLLDDPLLGASYE